MSLDFTKALKAPISTDGWVVKLIIGGILACIPIVNIIVLGYVIQYLTDVINKKETLPEFTNTGKIFVTGLKGVVGSILLSIPLLRRYFGEVAFRTEASLYQGLFVNLAYASVKFFSGIWYRSVWFGALAGYYILLAVMRFILLHYVRGRRQTGEKIIFEWNRYRLCGIILLLMNQTLAGIIILVVCCSELMGLNVLTLPAVHADGGYDGGCREILNPA